MDIKNRVLIEIGLKNRDSIRKIAKQINLNPSTVLREIKKNITVIKNPKNIKIKRNTNEQLNENFCELLNESPYVCNGCPRYINNTCHKNFQIYNHKYAEENYRKNKTNSSTKIKNINERLRLIEEINARIKKGQTIEHILISLKEEGIGSISKGTFYNWVKKGIIKYEKKKIKKIIKDNSNDTPTSQYLSKLERIKGREYNDFVKYINERPKSNIVEMDLVCGKRGTEGYILTLFIPKVQFLLAYKIAIKTPMEVLKAFDYIEKLIGTKNFKKLFEVILTDQGSEFLNRNILEKSKNSNNLKRCKIFYCEAGTPTQKAKIENIHRLVRRVYTKGSDLSNVTQEDLDELVSNINSLKKKSYGNKTPNEMFIYNYSKLLLDKLNIIVYDAKDVILNKLT